MVRPFSWAGENKAGRFADSGWADVVLMDYAISFVPNDILDMTARAAAKKVNPKITIEIRIGIGPAVVGKDIHVEDISFQGTMRIKLKLMVCSLYSER